MWRTNCHVQRRWSQSYLLRSRCYKTVKRTQGLMSNSRWEDINRQSKSNLWKSKTCITKWTNSNPPTNHRSPSQTIASKNSNSDQPNSNNSSMYWDKKYLLWNRSLRRTRKSIMRPIVDWRGQRIIFMSKRREYMNLRMNWIFCPFHREMRSRWRQRWIVSWWWLLS